MASALKLFRFGLCLLYLFELQGNAALWRRFLKGRYIIGGLFPVTKGKNCDLINEEGLAQAEALVFAIEMVNRNKTFLANETLGYDLRDTCGRVELTSRQAMSLAKGEKQIENCSSSETPSVGIVAIVGPSSCRGVMAASGIFSSHQLAQVRNIFQNILSSQRLSSFSLARYLGSVYMFMFLLR